MRWFWRNRCGVLIGVGGMLLAFAAQAQETAAPKSGSPLVLHARTREPGKSSSGSAADSYVVKEKVVEWNPSLTAIIVCDMWNQHWCQGATRRVGELAPVMNRTIAAARAKGVFIIHAPSSCMDAYKDHPARRRAQAAPKAASYPRTSANGATKFRPRRRGFTRLISLTEAATTGRSALAGRRGNLKSPPSRFEDVDAISDSGTEIWNMLESRGIKNIMLMGVHANMCVLGRPFGLRNMSRAGKNVVLVRDLTDTMYNSRIWPYVSHFEGTNRIVEHVEKYVAPSITSTDLTGQPAFQFKADNRPRAVFLIGEDEYKTETTLPAFAVKELEPLGVRCTFVIADPKTPHDFRGVEALNDADLLVLSVRRRAPTTDQMAIIRKYFDSGKPLVGIRTACHAFDARGKSPRWACRMEVVRPRRAGGSLHGASCQ